MRAGVRLVVGVLFLLAAEQAADAASVSFGEVRYRTPTAAQIIDDPALRDYQITEYFVTTDADILRVGQVVIDVKSSLYQHPSGSDAEPPNPLFVTVFPALGADTWITTPGITLTAGGGFANDNSAWFDTTNDGPVSNFKFASLTSIYVGSFRGVIAVAGAEGPEVFSFHFPLGGSYFPPPPSEPASMALAAVGLIGVSFIRRRRRWLQCS
jgi:hypothetical protein